MRIAIPLAGGRLSPHFGHCEEFAFFDVDNGEVLGRQVLPAPAHEPGALPAWLNEQGVELVIAGGIGMRAQQILARQGVGVVVGAASDAPEAIVSAYLDGELAAGENACDH